MQVTFEEIGDIVTNPLLVYIGHLAGMGLGMR